jgi:prolipoprotein diacylglyceryltransferase
VTYHTISLLIWGFSIFLGYYTFTFFTKKINTTLSHYTILLLTIYIITTGCIFGRFGVMLELFIADHNTKYTTDLFLSSRGIRVYSVMIGIYLQFFVFRFFITHRIVYSLMDCLALVYCICIAFVGIGCHLDGHGCYGNPTTMPWGMDYHWGIRPSYVPVHPIPLYNVIFHLPLFFILYYIYSKRQFDG